MGNKVNARAGSQQDLPANWLEPTLHSVYLLIYPDRVEKLVAIEGLRPLNPHDTTFDEKPLQDRLREWIELKQKGAARGPKCYSNLDEAFQRMSAENQHLSDEQVHHLTWHALNRNEDGSYSWKYDYYLNAFSPVDLPSDELHAI